MVKLRQWLLPHGLVDLLAQVGLVTICYMGYQLVRSLADHSTADAFANANQVIDWEHQLGIFLEPAAQAWAMRNGALIGMANWMYLNSHYLVSCMALLWIYRRHRNRFSEVRSSFLVAMMIALLGYALLPTAPPRMMPEWGFHDSVAAATGISAAKQQGSGLINMYAAVPSMHVGFALLVGWWMCSLSNRRSRWLWLAYPVLVTWVVTVTANHYLLDALSGALVATLSLLMARMIILVRRCTGSDTATDPAI